MLQISFSSLLLFCHELYLAFLHVVCLTDDLGTQALISKIPNMDLKPTTCMDGSEMSKSHHVIPEVEEEGAALLSFFGPIWWGPRPHDCVCVCVYQLS